MPRFKDYNYQQTVMLPVSFEQQILPGTFEHSINYLVDQKLDLSIFHQRYKNDDGGHPAYDPTILLKIALLAYSRGITSSRQIEVLCRDNVVFMAISADSRPHFTTIADFISTCPDEIAQLFQQMLLETLEQGKPKSGPIERMKQKIDSELGRHIYSQRMGMVGPVFGNIRETLGLARFTLRRKKKVDGQWKLMTMPHNLFKIHRYGWAA